MLTLRGERPLSNAEILIVDLRLSARSDSLGRFRLSDLPPGAHWLLVRRNGYSKFVSTVRVRDGQTIDADVLLETENGEARAAIAGRRSEFDERLGLGIGRFITADVFRQSEDRSLSSVIANRIPGVGVVGRGTLIADKNGGPRCPVQVILDGMTMYDGKAGQVECEVDLLNTSDVVGVEYYTSSNVPARYAGAPNGSGTTGGPGCGTVIIWTR